MSKKAFIDEDKAVLLLVKYIDKNSLKEGDRIPSIRYFADKWNMNASVIRSGFLRASTLGFIRLYPRSGAFVRQFDFGHIGEMFSLLIKVSLTHAQPRLIQLYDIRTILEKASFRIAVNKATPENIHELSEDVKKIEQAKDREHFILADEAFHLYIAHLTGNEILEVFLRAIFAMLRPDRMNFGFNSNIKKEVLKDHRAIYNAFVTKDDEIAEKLAVKHCERRKIELLSMIYE